MLAVWKYFPKTWYLTFSSVQHLVTFQLSRFDHTGAAIDTSWVQFNVSSLMTICLRRFEAGVETFPHISHKKVFVNDLYLLNGESHNVPMYGKTELGTRAFI